MFKLAILVAALSAVAQAVPGGLTSHIVDPGTGPIHAPNIVSHGHSAHVKVVPQPEAKAESVVSHVHYPSHIPRIPLHPAKPLHPAPLHGYEEPEPEAPHHQGLAPIVHPKPIVTKTVLPAHDSYVPLSLHKLR